MGKRGVFIDINGNEVDAVVVQIIENPISVKEAIFSPFQRMGRIPGGKIESIATTAEKKLDTTTSSALNPLEKPAPATDTAGKRMQVGGLLMGGGVAQHWAQPLRILPRRSQRSIQVN